MQVPIAIVLLASIIVAGSDPASRAWAEDGDAVTRSRAVIKDLSETLRSELLSGMKAGGPVAALGVCKTVAGDLAAEASKRHGLQVGRTSLRVRNPANAPDEFERRVLEDFLTKAKAGADVAALEHFEIVEEGNRSFRFMKAIPMAAQPCTACHGSSIEPEVMAAIKSLYPDDQATGFEAGELRGAFSVSGSAK